MLLTLRNHLFPAEAERGRITRNSALSLLDTVTTVLVYFLVMRHLVQVAGLEAVGMWSITMGYLAFLRMLDQGGAGSVTRFVASASEDKDERVKLIDTAFLFAALFFIFVALLGYFPISYLLENSVGEEAWGPVHNLLIGLLAILPINMTALGQLAALTGIGRADLRAAINISATLFYVSIALTLMSEYGVMALIYGQCAQYTIVLIISRVVARRKIAGLGFLPTKSTFQALRKLIGYGARLQATIVPIHIFHSLNRILIGRLVGLELLAIYELAYRFATSARQFIQALLNPMMPEFARLMVNGPDAAKKRYGQIAPLAIIATLGVSTLQLLAVPLVGYVMLGSLNYAFILVASCFTVGWGVANNGLTLQLYSRAAGVLRWAMLGQWLMLVLGVSLVFIADAGLSAVTVLTMPAVAIALGYLLAMIGESRHLGLLLLPSERISIVFTALAIFGSISITAVIISWTLLDSPVN